MALYIRLQLFHASIAPRRILLQRTRDDHVEIALELTVSVNTVKNHVRSIYTKLGVSNRRVAVLAAHELGLLTHGVR